MQADPRCIAVDAAAWPATGNQEDGMNPPEAEFPSDGAAVSDADLVTRMATGDRDAFSQLYDRFSRPLYSTALHILRDAAEAEDIIQDVFLSLWEKSGEFTATRGSAFAWAVTLTRNRAIDRIRMRKRRGELLAQAAPDDLNLPSHDDQPDSIGNAVGQEDARGVRAAVAELPPEQQEALHLAFFSGMTQQEIAAHLQQPLGTIKARIRRGLMKLREKFGDRR